MDISLTRRSNSSSTSCRDTYIETIPIKDASRSLQYYQKDAVHNVFKNIGGGVIPMIALPRSLGSSTGFPHVPHPSGSPPQFSPLPPPINQDTGKGGAKSGVNPDVITEWALPKGKRFGDFFNPRDLPANMKGWPTFPHHTSGKTANLCLKFQTLGKCSLSCQMAHFNAKKLDKATHDEITVRLHKIYKEKS